MAQTVKFLISTPENLKETLKECAKRQGYTLNGMVIHIFWDWLKNNADDLLRDPGSGEGVETA